MRRRASRFQAHSPTFNAFKPNEGCQVTASKFVEPISLASDTESSWSFSFGKAEQLRDYDLRGIVDNLVWAGLFVWDGLDTKNIYYEWHLEDNDDELLKEAIRDLDNARLEAAEEGYRRPSQLAISNARVILDQMYPVRARRYEVYPMPDGEIAVDAPVDGSSIVIVCDSEGGVLYLRNVSGEQESVRYQSLSQLSENKLREDLVRLEAIGG